MDTPYCKPRNRESLPKVCEPDLLDSMRAESVGVYEGMCKSGKYRRGPVSDRIGPTREAEENKGQMLDTTKPEIFLVHARLVEPSDH